MMTKAIEDLIETLKEEVALQKKIRDLGLEKRQALVRSEMAEVETITRREEQTLRPLGEAGLRRMRLTEQLGRTLTIGDREISVSTVARRVGEPFSEELRRLAAELRALIGEVGRITKTNAALIENSMVQVKEFLRIISGQGNAQEGTYTRRGLKPPKNADRALIDRVA